MKQHFEMFSAYNRWANDRVYAAVAELSDSEFNRNVGAAFGSAMATLNHVLAGDRIWQKRFTGQGEAPAKLDAILHRDLHGLRQARIAEDARIVNWVCRLTKEDLKGTFTYTAILDNRSITQRLSPALAHFFNHQTHHRGQVHTILTMLGQPSTPLDLIYFQRTVEGKAFA